MYSTILSKNLDISQSFLHFITRLIELNFNHSIHIEMPEKRLIGRAWRIIKDKKPIAFMLDAPGQFCTLQWQPINGELLSTILTITVYTTEEVISEVLLKIFRKSKSISQAIDMTLKESFELQPCVA